MDVITILISIIGIIGTLSSCYFAYVACNKENLNRNKEEGKTEGVIMTDIVYIKSCVERLELNLNKLDERYMDIVKKIILIEEKTTHYPNDSYKSIKK